MRDLVSIEKSRKVKLPIEYKKLYLNSFGNIKFGVEIYSEEGPFCIRKFLTTTEIINALDEFYDFFGYDIIPIAETDCDDYICLYYKDDRENPTVVYWNYELASISPEKGIFFLYDTIYEFEKELK